MEKRKQQKGALLVEVIAVLGLIALMTPILFDQIQKRNEEILNTQTASEMRALKEALSNYIQANEDWLAAGCNVPLDDEQVPEDCGFHWLIDNECADSCDGTEAATQCSMCASTLKYFGGGINQVSAATILKDYEVKFFGGTVPSGNSGFRPIIYAVAYQAEPPETQNFRRAAKTAALIGVEGGVVQEANTISGMQDVWRLEIDGVPQNAVAVTTSFDSVTNSAILKDATFSNMQASNSVQAPVVAAQAVGVKDLFSVSASEDCIADYGADSVTLHAKSESGSACTPIFEVDAQTGEVTVNGVLKVQTTCNQLTEAECSQASLCEWSGGACSAKNSGDAYKLDIAGTSVMEDIKLTSRGGAKLSEILPKWSLMKVTQSSSSPATVSITSCPDGYKYGIVVVPQNFTVQASHSAGQAGSVNVTVSADAPQVNATKNNVSVIWSGADKVLIYEYCVYES